MGNHVNNTTYVLMMKSNAERAQLEYAQTDSYSISAPRTKSVFLTNVDVQYQETMVNFVQLSVNAIVTQKLKFAVLPERIPMAAQSNQLVNQRERTCTTKSVPVSASKHANTMRSHANSLMTQTMAVLIQITVKLNKLITLENSVISNNANLSVIIPNTFAKETSYMTVAKKMIFAYQNNLMISPQTVCAQELAPLNAKTGKSNVTVPLITTEIFTRDARDKMSVMLKLRIPMEYSAPENLTLMDAHTHAHLRKYCALPKKDYLDAKKRPNVLTEQPMTKENTAQIPLIVQPSAHQTTSTAQEELMKMDVRNQIFALKSTETSMVMYVQSIVLRTVKMMKYSAQEPETQSMVATARTSANQRTPMYGEKLLDLTVPDGAQLSAMNMKSCALP